MSWWLTCPGRRSACRKLPPLWERPAARCGIELVDVTSEADQRRTVKAVIESFGRLDFAFNNAGVEQQTPFLEITEDAFDWVMGINTKGVFLGMKAQLEVMVHQASGVIVNTASIEGLLGLPGYASYSTSKHAVVGLTKSVAVEVAGYGIRINAIAPFSVDSPMLAELSAEARAGLMSGQPIKRIGTPEEIAEAVLWLTSSRSSYTTGTVMPIDGGLSAS